MACTCAGRGTPRGGEFRQIRRGPDGSRLVRDFDKFRPVPGLVAWRMGVGKAIGGGHWVLVP
jgi:hypothetical protein